MILGLFGGLIIIIICLFMALASAFAVNFWIIFVPLFLLWFVIIYNRERTRQKNVTPQERAQIQKYADLLQQQNEMFKRGK